MKSPFQREKCIKPDVNIHTNNININLPIENFKQGKAIDRRKMSNTFYTMLMSCRSSQDIGKLIMKLTTFLFSSNQFFQNTQKIYDGKKNQRSTTFTLSNHILGKKTGHTFSKKLQNKMFPFFQFPSSPKNRFGKQQHDLTQSSQQPL